MERELEKDLKEIEYLIYVHKERENTHTQSVLERAHEIIEPCAKAAKTLPELEELLSVVGIIRKHMNDGWVSVEDRLPEKNEYFVDTSSNKEFPNGYYRRLEIAYMTDTVEYIHGYYDGYKWMDEYLDAIKNVVAWRIHEPYRSERSRENEK